MQFILQPYHILLAALIGSANEPFAGIQGLAKLKHEPKHRLEMFQDIET